MDRLILKGVLLTWCAGTFAGCATVDQKAILQNKPVATAVVGSEVVFLTMDGNAWNDSHRMKPLPLTQKLSPFKTISEKKIIIPQKITLVKVKTDKGITAGMYVMPLYSGDLIISSLKKELSAAGYKVISVRRLPEKAKIGINISRISTNMEQDSRLLTLEGKCDLRIRLDMWQNGSRFVSHDYASIVSDYSITDQNLLLARVMRKATQNITEQALPNIINDIAVMHK